MFTLKWKLENLVRIDLGQTMGQYDKKLLGFYKEYCVHPSLIPLLPAHLPYFREIPLTHYPITKRPKNRIGFHRYFRVPTLYNVVC